MRLIVTCEHRFSLAPDGSVWTRVAFDYAFWQRYLAEFDSVRIVARAAIDPNLNDSYKKVTGPGVEFWTVPYYLGPEQFLMRRHKIKKSLLAAVGENDALLCRVGSPIADELLPHFWRADRPYGLEVVGDPEEAIGTIGHPLRRFFRRHAARMLRLECSRAAAVAYVTRETLQRKYPCPAHSVGVSDVARLDFSNAPRVFTTNYSSITWDEDAFATGARVIHGGRCPRILFVGSLAQMYKGPDVLLKAAQNFVGGMNAQVVIVGDGKHRPELERMAADLGISENVQFLGELPSGKPIREQLDQATLFVLPSRSEGLPRAVIEAMARGVPCIATRVGGIPELLAEEDMVAPEDWAGLASKIKEVVCDPQRLSEMSRRNLERAQEYNPQVLEERRTEFYRFLRHRTEGWLAEQGRSLAMGVTA